MKRAVVLLGLLAACKADGGGGDDYGAIPGPGRSPSGTQDPPTGGGPRDAGLGDATFDGGTQLTVELCLLSDFRQYGTAKPGSGCGAAPDGTLVFAGNRPATRGTDGKYAVFAPQGQFTWRVETPTDKQQLLLTTLMPADSAAPVLPVVSREDYLQVINSSSLPGNVDDLGGVFVRVLDRGSPLTGTTAAAGVGSAQGAFYDNDRSAVTWTQNATGTGAHSIVWFADIQASGSLGITLTPPTAAKLTAKTTPATVQPGAITFMTFDFE